MKFDCPNREMMAGSKSSSVQVPIGLDDDGTYPQSVSSGAFSDVANLTIVRPPQPLLTVDDPLLSLISACGTYQTTPLRATAGGVDVAAVHAERLRVVLGEVSEERLVLLALEIFARALLFC